jgi:hypothetical protein
MVPKQEMLAYSHDFVDTASAKRYWEVCAEFAVDNCHENVDRMVLRAGWLSKAGIVTNMSLYRQIKSS